jgi:hypothetical protein
VEVLASAATTALEKASSIDFSFENRQKCFRSRWSMFATNS